MTRLMTAMALSLCLVTAALSGEVPLGDDGLHKPDWLKQSFKDLPEDLAEAVAANRHLMLIVEQRGCIYCAKLHAEVLTDPAVLALIRDRFDVVQIDLFGGTTITDLDGKELTEKRAAGKWGVTLTPTLILMPDAPADGADAARAAMAVIPGVPEPAALARVLDWASRGGPESGASLAEVLGN